MKKFFYLSMFLLSARLGAQTLDNPNFESWSIGGDYGYDTVPTQWWSMYCNTTHQTTDAMAGTYATRLQGYMSCGIAQGIMVNGTKPVNYWDDLISAGTPFGTKPASITGAYKYTNVATGDSAEVTIILKKYNNSLHKEDTVAIGRKALEATPIYSTYTVAISDKMPGVLPDSIVIIFNSSKYNMWDTVTYALPNLYVDRIAMPESTSGIGESSSSLLATTVYPNPFSSEATLAISGNHGQGTITLSIYDAGGKMVGEKDGIRQDSIQLRSYGLAPGTYFYLLHDGKTIVGKGKFSIR